MFKFVCLLACVAIVAVNVEITSAQGNNLYLPPKEPGYDYPKPGAGPSPGPPSSKPQPSRPSQPSKPPTDEQHEPGMPFDFNYAVNDAETKNDYNHKANSDGDVTRGEYRVQLPDGRTQVVRYTADWKNGYNAEVSYE